MSIWTSRTVLAGLALAGVTACSDIALPGIGAARGDGPAKSVEVARGTVTIAGPRGYCVDRQASRTGGAQPFVLLASCQALGAEEGTPRPVQAGLLTASVRDAPPGATDGDALIRTLERYFQSEDGRAALARDGQAGSVGILDIRRQGEALDMQVEDRSAAVPSGTGPRYWRSLFLRNGQLVTLSVLSFDVQPLDTAVGEATLAAFRRAVEAATPARTSVPVAGNRPASPFAGLQRLLPGN